MQKKWKINKKTPKAFLNKFPEYSRLTLQLLWDRGLKTQKAIDEFFNPDYDQDLHDPFLMKGMKKAVARVEKALKNKEKITIFGDYDADGICGAAILSETLKYLGNKADVYIPDRNKEGYGMNLKAVEEAAKNKTSLILTVDCGITDVEEIKLAKKLGIDTVVIDHHQVPKKIPTAFAIVNPHQKEEKYPFREFAAAGVAFKFVQALLKTARKKGSISFEKWLLDLVAIATVVDMMPVRGENRTLIKYGLVVLAQTKRPGLRRLMELAGIKPELDAKLLTTNLDVHILGYILGPRLNAAGRMDHANTAYELLITRSEEEARVLAERLNNKNQDRQKLTDRISKQAERRLKKKKLIFEGDKDWPLGIAGIIAGKLSNKYYRPAVIFQKAKTQTKGSARSIPSFNIVEAISQCGELLEDFGGHPAAAGFTVSNQNLDKFRSKLLKIAENKIKKQDLVPVINIDSELKPEEFNFETHEEVQRFAPFGEENYPPIFLLRDLKISSFRKVGSNGGHLKLYLTKELNSGETKGFQAIGFGLGDFCDRIKQRDRVDIVFELIINEWNGTRELQLNIKDIQCP